MTEALERNNEYVLDGSDADLQRLLGVSEVLADGARMALTRVGVRPGWHAIDCGCGPIGALAVLAEMVGPRGRAVGIDFAEDTVRRARSAAAALQLDNVEVISGDVNAAEVDGVGGPYDVAFTRCFLMHQPDPVHTLGRIAGLLRPGGWIVAQEALRTPPPRSHPQRPVLEDYWEIIHALIERAGVPPNSMENLPRAAADAGLEVVHTSGYVAVIEPSVGFELHAATLAAAKERAMQLGVATEQEIGRVLTSLRSSASDDTCSWAGSPTFLDLALHKPAFAR